jgi:hypothetical protein
VCEPESCRPISHRCSGQVRLKGVLHFSPSLLLLAPQEIDLVVLNCQVGPAREDGALTHQCCKKRGLNYKMTKLSAIAM